MSKHNMKSFFHFLSETSTPVVQATRLGLTGDGHGGWYDKSGEFIAKTEKGKLKFYNKDQRPSKDGPQNNTEPTPKPTSSQAEPQQTQQTQQVPQEGEFGMFADGTPRRMPPPVNADGSPKEDRGEVTLTFGRFNFPTTGHEKLFQQAKKVAGKGDLRIYPSRSVDSKKNPLDPDEKIDIMHQMFPDYSRNIVNDPNVKTIFDALKQAHEDGYSNVKIVVGGDRVNEFEKMSSSYNGKLYDFSNVETASAGERSPDSEGVEGMSASKMRKAAAENDFKTFRSGVPDHIDDKTATLFMNTLRKKMKITKESWSLWEIAPKLDWKNLRENYVAENIFCIGDIVENLNTGLVGKVIRRGASYLICVTEDNILFKPWIRDVKEYTEVSGVPANQREIGTDKLRKYAMSMVGVTNIKNFINKYKQNTSSN